MKIDAASVTTTNMQRTVEFYTFLGFDFTGVDVNAGHVEPQTPEGSARLMIDDVEIVKETIGTDPKPGNHSSFAINYPTPAEVDNVAEKVKVAGFSVVKEPWDAFWGQRYAVIADPDGYRIDLYANMR